MPIDYERMKRTFPKHKAALTRATKKENALARWVAVKAACKAAVTEWNEIGAWPDDWARWQVALGDALFNLRRTGHDVEGPIRLEEL